MAREVVDVAPPMAEVSMVEAEAVREMLWPLKLVDADGNSLAAVHRRLSGARAAA
jgi:hypothetical protein